VIHAAIVMTNKAVKPHVIKRTNGGESSLKYSEASMENKYFTAFDGTVYIAKVYLKRFIADALLNESPNRSKYSVQRFAEKILKELDTCYYKEQIPEITNPDIDYFYCGSCRRGFPVAYTAEMVRCDTRPCPTCGAQSSVTPKLGQEENDEKDNIEGERS